jgi:hypothetical protein
VIHVTYFDPVSGRILGGAICTAEEAVANTPEGAQTLEGIYNGLEFYIANGVPTRLPPKTNDFCVFDYAAKQWIDVRTTETQWGLVRSDRNNRLQVTDWTQLADISAETKALWEPYRQALRDVSSQPDPFNIVWPTPPQ